MSPEEFILSYQKALASQDWNIVEPLITNQGTVTFSNGTVHKGIDAVKAAFEKNFSLIKSEKYIMKNIVWLKREIDFAVYIFEYSWSGIMNGELISGSGLGTSTIIKEGEVWKLLIEHLGNR